MSLIRKRGLPTPTAVYSAYWTFAAERQRIFRARLKGAAWATKDPILQRFRFTNAYRASDRVSQFLIGSVIYDAHREWRDTWLRVMLFKLFNRIETWVGLERRVGEVGVDSFDASEYVRSLDEVRVETGALYSAAYIMPSAGELGSRHKHVNHVHLVEKMLSDGLPDKLQECPSAEGAFSELLTYPSIGSFLSYQLLTDLSYSPDLRFQESEFVSPGPGALDGLRKCFSDPGDFSPREIIRWTAESQVEEFARREIAFDDLWGRPLQLIDCQNLYCEIGKYAREAFPDIPGVSQRKRIKHTFRPASQPLSAWYPPKWGINDAVEKWLSENAVIDGSGAGVGQGVLPWGDHCIDHLTAHTAPTH